MAFVDKVKLCLDPSTLFLMEQLETTGKVGLFSTMPTPQCLLLLQVVTCLVLS